MIKPIMLVMGTLLMTGCLFTVDSDHRSDDARWSEREVTRLEKGHTSSQTVRSIFGEPTRESHFDDGSALWHYTRKENVDTEVGVFLLFHLDVKRDIVQQLTIEISDGVVRDYWLEESR